MKPTHPLYFIKESFTPPPADSGRLDFIDLAKGICIILVIILHTLNAEIPNTAALRMPLYFFVSGLFFRTYDSPRIFLLKKINNLIVPFLFWQLFTCLTLFIVGLLFNHELSFQIVSNIKSNKFYNENWALWFLTCLFLSGLIFYIIKQSLNEKCLLLTVVLIGFVSYIFSQIGYNKLYILNGSLIALPLIYMGYIIQKYYGQDNLKKTTKGSKIFLGASLIILSYAIYILIGNFSPDISNNIFIGNPIIAYLNSLLFIGGTICICSSICWLPIISYFGRYSIIVLCCHHLFQRILNEIIPYFHGHELRPIYIFPIVLLLCWVTIPLCRRFIPQFVAQKPLINPNLELPQVFRNIFGRRFNKNA